MDPDIHSRSLSQQKYTTDRFPIDYSISDMPPPTNATPVKEQSNDNGTPYQEFKLAYARIWNSTADVLDQLPFDKVVVKPIANNESTRSLLKASHANFKLELGIMMENNSTIKLFAHLVKKNQMETLDTSFEIESTPYKLIKIPKLIGANNVVLNEAFEFIKSDKILIALIKVYFLYLGAAVPNDWHEDEKKTGFMNHAKDLVTFMCGIAASGLKNTVPRSDLSVCSSTHTSSSSSSLPIKLTNPRIQIIFNQKLFWELRTLPLIKLKHLSGQPRTLEACL